MNNRPLVSVIMNCYNADPYLKEAIDSVYAQTYENWEIIFWDNASTDKSAEIAKGYDDGRLKYFCSDETVDLGAARNLAIAKAGGKYIAFLDSDDIWQPTKIEKQIKIFANQPEVDFIYTNYDRMIMYDNNRLITAFNGAQPQGYVFETLIYNYQVCISTVIVTKRALFALDQVFDSRFNHIEEFDVFMRLLYDKKAAYIDETLAIYRIHKNMTTIKAIELLPREFTCMVDKFKLMDPLFESKYPDVVQYIEVKLVRFTKAKYEIINGDTKVARQYIAAYKWYNMKTLLLYIASFLPNKLILFFYNSLFFVRGKV